MALAFAAVADDDTGATDLAGMLAERGMRAILLLEQPAPEEFAHATRDADAVVIGTASRSIDPGEAYRRTRAAVALLKSANPAVLEIKYCSTFDSTPAGNIGQSIDAAMDETGAEFTVALPALPVNGRTTYMGHHFVERELLSDSSMRHHPLNPMTESNLVKHLQSQTKRRVGLLALQHVQEGPARVRSRLKELCTEGVEIAILDCTSDRELEILSEGIGELPLVTGSSALGIRLPLSWKTKAADRLRTGSDGARRGFLVVAGATLTRHVARMNGLRRMAGRSSRWMPWNLPRARILKCRSSFASCCERTRLVCSKSLATVRKSIASSRKKERPGLKRASGLLPAWPGLFKKQWALRLRKELCSRAVKRPAPLRACSGSERSGWAQISSLVCLSA